MSVKSVVAERLEKARLFADSVRTAYEGAYSKATNIRKGGVNELIKDIQPKLRSAVEDGIHNAQAVLDDFNQSLADKAIPSFRKGAVSREQLEQKAKGAKIRKNSPKTEGKSSKATVARSKVKPSGVKNTRVKTSGAKRAPAKR